MNSISSLKSITAHLPGQWAFMPTVYDGNVSKDAASLVRADGLELWMRTNEYNNKGKISVRLIAPKNGREYVTLYNEGPGASGQTPVPSINVGETKTGEQIAGDIARRLLPDAETYFKRVNAIIKSRTEHANARLNTLKEICAAIGSPVPTNSATNEARYTLAVGDYQKIGYGDITVSSADSITIKLDSMSKENALKVIECLRQLGAFETDRARMRNGN